MICQLWRMRRCSVACLHGAFAGRVTSSVGHACEQKHADASTCFVCLPMIYQHKSCSIKKIQASSREYVFANLEEQMVRARCCSAIRFSPATRRPDGHHEAEPSLRRIPCLRVFALLDNFTALLILASFLASSASRVCCSVATPARPATIDARTSCIKRHHVDTKVSGLHYPGGSWISFWS